MFTTAAAVIPYDSSLSPLPNTKPRRQAHAHATLAQDPTLKFLLSQRPATARAFEHAKSEPDVPITTGFIGPALSNAVVMKDGRGTGIGDSDGQGEGWRRLDHLWSQMRKE